MATDPNNYTSDPPKGEDPHPDYEHDDPGESDNPRDLNDDGRVTKKERERFKESKRAFNKWWKRASANADFTFPPGVAGSFREAAFEAWLDGYTPRQLVRLFNSRAASVLFGNSTAAGFEGYNNATTYDAQLEFLSDPEHFQAFIDSIQPGAAGTQYIKQVFSGGGFAEWAEANGISTDDPNASTLYHEYRTGLHQAFYDANPGLQEFRAQQALEDRDQYRADLQAGVVEWGRGGAGQAVAGTPSAGGVYMNINPEIPWTESLGRMGNIFAGHAAQAFSSGDPDAIQRASDSMNAYAQWNSQFNSVFNQAAPQPPAANTYITGFEYDDIVGEIN